MGICLSGGTTTPFHFGETITGKFANYGSNTTYGSEKKIKSPGQTTPVASFSPNAFGLYDMHGNVWEWCEDHWHGSYQGAPSDGSAWLDANAEKTAERVLRGGSWGTNPRNCRSASRVNDDAGVRYYDYFFYGFRVVCSAPRTS